MSDEPEVLESIFIARSWSRSRAIGNGKSYFQGNL